MRLFAKITLILAVTIFVTAIFSFLVTSDLVEDVFVESYVDTQSKIIEVIVDNFEQLTTDNMELITLYSNSNYLNELLGDYHNKTDLDLFKCYYELHKTFQNVDKNILPARVMTLGKSNTIYSRDGRVLKLSLEELASHPITQLSIDNPNQLKYVYDENGFYVNQPSIIGVKQLQNSYTGKSAGTIYLHYEEVDFRNQYSMFASKQNDIFMINEDGVVVSSSRSKQLGGHDNEMLHIAMENREHNRVYTLYEENKETHIVFTKYLPIYEMYVVNTISMSDTVRDFDVVKMKLFYFNMFFALLGILLVFIVIKRLMFPLSQIIMNIKGSKGGRFEKIEDLGAGVEVLELKEAYNYMIDEINARVDEIMEVENEKRLIEFATLQMQINPHFLYNTLATIKYLAWQNENEKVANTIEDLIDLLQNTVSNHNELITVREEMDNLESYIRINEVRYGDKIQTRIFVDDECEVDMIPKLILQPFVENAYFHAFQKKKSGRIIIECYEKEGALYFIIKDNGDGMRMLENQAVASGGCHFTGIGIENVDQRIKIMFGEEYGVKIGSVLGQGTEVRIKLPK